MILQAGVSDEGTLVIVTETIEDATHLLLELHLRPVEDVFAELEIESERLSPYSHIQIWTRKKELIASWEQSGGTTSE